MEAQEASFEERPRVLEDLRHGLYLRERKLFRGMY